MKNILIFLGLYVLGTADVQANDRDEEEALFLCWSAYSSLAIIGREDGQELVNKMFKDMVYSIWNVGIDRGIQPLDSRYTTTRDQLLASYRAGEVTYDDLMSLNLPCAETFF